LEFTLLLPEARIRVTLKTLGRFMVSNALAAAAVGYHIGFAAREIKTGLEAFRPVAGRLNLHETGTGVHIINDTYNANPDSMRAAIETLQTLKEGQRGVLVAGDMLELGTQADRLHTEIGVWAARHGVDRLYATGTFASRVAAGARSEGLSDSDVFIGSQEEILSDLSGWLQAGDWVLVKGSRGMRMERVVEGLLADATPGLLAGK
jgi:UDP-N-acetylmuramoyl-tripeptide--D-alanyl-D-alanine ligase